MRYASSEILPITGPPVAPDRDSIVRVVLDGWGVWAYGGWRVPGAKGIPVYPGPHALERADQAAFVMASTGESVSYAEYEARTNRLAHLLRARGLRRLDHYAIFMENNDRYLEACGAGERAGLYYTCVNSYLTAPELAYILNNSTAKLLITSRACREVALEAARDCPGLTRSFASFHGDHGLWAGRMAEQP